MKKDIYYTSFFIFFFSFASIFSQTSNQTYFPSIIELSSKDPVFKQYCQDVELNYKKIAKEEDLFSFFYTYTPKSEDTLLSISSRCNIPYETIATINRISSIHSDVSNKTLYLPTCPGLFITQKPLTTIENLLILRTIENNQFSNYIINGETFYFIPNEKFSGTERLFFLNDKIRSPLPQGILSSKYGLRQSPITGKKLFHNGIDLAADLDTPVLACLSGTILECGYNDVYGNYVVILHDNNIKSFYAHLKTFASTKNSYVQTGEVIGYVGMTGLTTGPHLHFEIYISGQTEDPWKLIN